MRIMSTELSQLKRIAITTIWKLPLTVHSKQRFKKL